MDTIPETLTAYRWPMRQGESVMDTRDEQALARALVEGDRAAADELVDRTYRMVYAVLHRLTGGDAELAADLTQETYRKAWSSLAGFHFKAQFSTWLYRIAYTTFLNHVRRPRRVVPLEDEAAAERLGDPEEPIDSKLVAGSDAERLRKAVLGLPDDLRFTVTAHYWRGLSVAEVAALENITTVAIRKRLKRAFQILALAMEEDT